MRRMLLTLVGVGMLVLCGGQIAQAHGPGHYGHGWGPRPGYGYYHAAPRGYYGSYYRGGYGGGYGYGGCGPNYAAVPYGYAYPAPGFGVATRNFSFFLQP